MDAENIPSVFLPLFSPDFCTKGYYKTYESSSCHCEKVKLPPNSLSRRYLSYYKDTKRADHYKWYIDFSIGEPRFSDKYREVSSIVLSKNRILRNIIRFKGYDPFLTTGESNADEGVLPVVPLERFIVSVREIAQMIEVLFIEVFQPSQLKKNLGKEVCLSQEVKNKLFWLVNNLHQNNGKSMVTTKPRSSYSLAASLKSWRTFCMSQ